MPRTQADPNRNGTQQLARGDRDLPSVPGSVRRDAAACCRNEGVSEGIIAQKDLESSTSNTGLSPSLGSLLPGRARNDVNTVRVQAPREDSSRTWRGVWGPGRQRSPRRSCPAAGDTWASFQDKVVLCPSPSFLSRSPEGPRVSGPLGCAAWGILGSGGAARRPLPSGHGSARGD